MMNKYLSIITNFGCHYRCPYCIVRENNLHIPKTTLQGLLKLPEAVRDSKCNWLSISGGGDPMFQVDGWADWWMFMLELKSLFFPMVKLELHTSYIKNCITGPIPDPEYYDNLVRGSMDRIVYHVREPWRLHDITRYKNNQIVRVVFVVTKDFTPEKIDDIVKILKANPNIDELSFRQMVDDHYLTTHYCEDYLRAGHKKDWYYITQGDYNLYYCEGEVSTKFEDFKEE